jgi:hypothetical protein
LSPWVFLIVIDSASQGTVEGRIEGPALSKVEVVRRRLPINIFKSIITKLTTPPDNDIRHTQWCDKDQYLRQKMTD